jgi:hypothetical protein
VTVPVYDRFGVQVFHGDNLDVLRGMPDCSIDSIVTDPPAGIGFMREWDSNRGGREQWVAWLSERMAEALRVLKPGGHALVWAMPRTSHWTGLALEDAGFEMRDVLQHVYDGGYPKSLDVAKAIDARGGHPELAAEIGAAIRQARTTRDWTTGQADRYFCGGSTNWTWFEGRKGVYRPPTGETFARIVAEWPELAELAAEVATAEREVVGETRSGLHRGSGSSVAFGVGRDRRLIAVTESKTEQARKWNGWGTALRPAAEPWWLCR